MELLLNPANLHEQKALLRCMQNYELSKGIPPDELWLIAIHLYYNMQERPELDTGYHEINQRYQSGEDPYIHEFLLLFTRKPSSQPVFERIWAVRAELAEYEKFSEPRRLREIVNTVKDEPVPKQVEAPPPSLDIPCKFCKGCSWTKMGELHYCNSCSYFLI